jgi:hypothetical protein
LLFHLFFNPAVGVLLARFRSPPRIEEFREGLRDLGYVEAENIIIEY